jgi:hypothetical protein
MKYSMKRRSNFLALFGCLLEAEIGALEVGLDFY